MQIGSVDIAHRPQPIRRMPHSESTQVLMHSESTKLSGIAAAVKDALDPLSLPRPSSTGSSFQPIGAFRAKLKDMQSMSAESENIQNEEKMEMRKTSFSTSSVPGLVAAASAAVPLAMVSGVTGGGRVQYVQQTPVKVGPMTIHNITMMQEQQHLIVSSDTQTTLGCHNSNGPILGKISKGMGRVNSQRIAPQQHHQQQQQQQHHHLHQQHQQHQIMVQPNAILGKPATSSMVQIVAAPQLVATCAGQISGTVTSTFATTAKPISTPIPIASKPTNSSAMPSNTKVSRTASLGSISMPSATILPSAQTAKYSTIVLQGNQYSGMTLLDTSSLTTAQGQKIQAGNSGVHHTVNPQGFMTTYRNVAPPPHTSPQAAQPVQTVATQPAHHLVTNLVLKTNATPPAGGGHQQQAQAPTQTLSIAPSQQPTHVRYILPSVQVVVPQHHF